MHTNSVRGARDRRDLRDQRDDEKMVVGAGNDEKRSDLKGMLTNF